MIRCLIVEDEPLAAEVLKDYVQQVPYLELKGVCSDAIFAIEVLTREKIDLLFLDIHLPGLKGIDLLRTLASPPQVIITTAYNEYALQGYEMNVIDYLLKPIEFKRFLQAVNKVQRPSSMTVSDTLTIQTDKKKVIIPLSDILFIESQKEYIQIQTISDVYHTKYSLTKVENELDVSRFLRIHRSFIVGLRHIKAFNLNEVHLPGKIIPIGGNYKNLVAQRFNQYF
ncbi:MAG: response regulator transcription factor [Cyclobacteriaceae bacterium]|nr:response regulator transcription factor [Cyclobacteriaceae bacterium]